ncbi:hypothetical protein [Halalkalibacter urbisdiaboli]|uniref:hypothetical protein n=1 Tax=Halalkalibacter urbisdiaboli TaxID=1960589 RepID=UPI000B42F010|nr:hypothetical protein [Halalkalibacter urbisdiaboli]
MLDKTIIKYKKLFEKYEIVPYSIEVNGENYKFVQYFRFNSPTGTLALNENGEIIGFNIAKKVATYFLRYNSSMLNSARLDIMRAKELELPNETVRTLRNLRTLSRVDEEIINDIDAIINAYSIHIEGQELLNKIGNEYDYLDIQIVRKTNLLTEKDVLEADKLENKFAAIVYKQALYMDETTKNRERLLNWIQTIKKKLLLSDLPNIQESERLLRYSQKKVVLSTLRESIKNFEKDVPILNKTNLEERVEEFIQKRTEKKARLLQDVIRTVRNPE